MDAFQAKSIVGRLEVLRAAREVLLAVVRRTVDLPRKKALRNRDDLVALGTITVVRAEGQHRAVLGVVVVTEREARIHVVLDGLRAGRTGEGPLASTKEARVATRDVARAHDVTHDADVLRLGDHRLGVAGVVPGNGLGTLSVSRVQ